MRGVDNALPFNNAAAGTSAAFTLNGGRYLLTLGATGSGGTVGLQRNIGGTYVGVSPAFGVAALTAAGSVVYDLPPGQYKLVITTLTANTASIDRVPGE